VSRRACAQVAQELGLGSQLLERGAAAQPEELARLAQNRNVLAALLEAAFAAIYLEHGFEAVEGPIVDAFRGQMEYAATHSVDYKTELQEELARIRKQVLYTVLETEGPAHDRRFTCAAVIDGEQRGVGTGSTKKEAEQEAALQALQLLAQEPSE
jgi:ribonuclease III